MGRRFDPDRAHLFDFIGKHYTLVMFKAFVKSKIHPLVWQKLGQAKQEFAYVAQKYHCDENLIPFFTWKRNLLYSFKKIVLSPILHEN